MSSKRNIVLFTAYAGIVAYLWQSSSRSKDPNGRPIKDSFGQKIDYGHSISYIPDSTDPEIVQTARKSWLLEEKIRKQKLGDNYEEIPFSLHHYYGGYRD